jgi:asparagine synthase (glutamine-hydrolysing)
MCGIIGVSLPINKVNKNEFDKGLLSISHRGPDSSGTWFTEDERIFLGHRRLSVIDLSENARQPMILQKEKLVVVFNGEIYNYLDIRRSLEEKGYTFVSKSDTEVLLKAYIEWGINCVDYLIGMFSFVIYDILKDQFFLSRDRAGEKPLYYYLKDGNFYFSSEVRGILSFTSVSKKLDQNATDVYFSFGFQLGEKTLVDNLKQLLPGHSAIFNNSSRKLHVWKYWSIPDFDNSNLATEDLLYQLESLLEKSVKSQLVSDVPIGVLLSGGLDSSIMTAIAANNARNIKTFTVKNVNSKYDESSHANLISNYFSTNHTEFILDIDDVDFENIVNKFDLPIGDSSLIPTYLISKLVRSQCTVAIGGDGGDELFGGYKSYNQIFKINRVLKYFPQTFTSILNKYSNSLLPIGFKGKALISRLNYDRSVGLPINLLHFDIISRKKMFKDISHINICAEDIFESLISNDKDILQRAMKFDFSNSFVNDILFKVDRMSMLNSLEMRAPFLDKNIIEFAFSKVPISLKANASQRKIILKQLAQKILPKEFDLTRKLGFSFPLDELIMRHKNIKLIKDVLYDSKSIFNQEFVSSIFDGLNKGRANADRIFMLYCFENWRQKNGIL